MGEIERVPDPAPASVWPSALPRPVATPRPGGTLFVTRFERDFRHGPWSMGEVTRRSTREFARLVRRGEGAALDWERALFLDLEAGTHPRGGPCVWLAGTGRFHEGALRVEQQLLADADEEGALVAFVASALQGCDALVSFSGRSFDVPMLTARAAANQVDLAWPPHHFDLYRLGGRLFPRSRFGDQKLQTFERQLLGFTRYDDLPGSALPAAWHELSEPGHQPLLEAALLHNLLDVLSLPALAAELAFRLESPQDPAERREFADAQAAAHPDRSALERALELDPDSWRAHLELSKQVERDEGDLAAALDHARRALELVPSHREALVRRRVEQLERRQERATRRSGGGAMTEEPA